LVGRPEEKRPLRRPKSRWEDNIKIDLQDVEGKAWIRMICVRIGTGDGLL
jgi:hypothetical protein